MDVERAVEDFVRRGKDLFDQLRAEGQTLSSVGLQILRTQLHILGIEAARLKHANVIAERSKIKHVKAKTPNKLKPAATCPHRRAIDDYFDEKGNRTNLFYCLECGTVIGGSPGSE